MVGNKYLYRSISRFFNCGLFPEITWERKKPWKFSKTYALNDSIPQKNLKRPRVDELLNGSLDELEFQNPSVVVHPTSRLELLPSRFLRTPHWFENHPIKSWNIEGVKCFLNDYLVKRHGKRGKKYIHQKYIHHTVAQLVMLILINARSRTQKSIKFVRLTTLEHFDSEVDLF